MTNDFKNKSLNRDRISDCLKDIGVENFFYEAKNASGHHHLNGTYQENNFLLNVFENKNGTTTLGFSVGQDRELFEFLAEEIVRCCSYSENSKLEFSIPRFQAESLNGLLEFLFSEGATVQEEKELPYGGIQRRLQGRCGDTITITYYQNETIQFQGKHVHLATCVWDYLFNVLSLEDALTKQSQTYEINVTVNDIKNELEAKIPVSHQFLEDTVRKQLSSALMLCKIVVPLEDYSAIAFPALRGLEGFIKQVLLKGGLRPADKGHIGEYFEQKVVGSYVLKKNYADHVGDPYSNILAGSYTFYFNQRHGIFHMDASVETSRILGALEDAKRIVFDVFEIIEVASKELCI